MNAGGRDNVSFAWYMNSTCDSTPGKRGSKPCNSVGPHTDTSPVYAPDASLAGPSRAKSASRSLRRALLTPQVNTGSLYRCGRGGFKRAAAGYVQQEETAA